MSKRLNMISILIAVAIALVAMVVAVLIPKKEDE